MRLDARSLAPILILGLTSAGAYLAGTRLGGLHRAELPRAIMDVLGALGLAVAFLLGNHQWTRIHPARLAPQPQSFGVRRLVGALGRRLVAVEQ